jgi:hypothetical protein
MAKTRQRSAQLPKNEKPKNDEAKKSSSGNIQEKPRTCFPVKPWQITFVFLSIQVGLVDFQFCLGGAAVENPRLAAATREAPLATRVSIFECVCE